MMDTKEMLTYAAKACGIKKDDSPYNGGGFGNDGFDSTGSMVLDWHNGKCWNPATDQADSDRMGTKLHMNVIWYIDAVVISHPDCQLTFPEYFKDHNGDECAALRAARLRCAVEIGKGME